MLYENMKPYLKDQSGKNAGKDSMSLLLVRPFDIVYKGKQYPVIMVRVDTAGNRHLAVPNDDETSNDAFLWIAERWIDKVIPSDTGE